MHASVPEATTALVAALDLEQKVRLLTGQDFWTTWPEPALGLRSLVFSDGPAGVRGVQWDEREPSLSLPSGSALGATWDVALARRYGEGLAQEAIRKGVDIVLGPTVNIQRSPLGGRHFESFSEDPELTGRIAAAYIEGIQSRGVAATPKHYVGNESETDRFTVDTVIDERTLREVYLRPFELAVVEGRAWALMSAYNSINGTTASESDLLRDPLRSEWGFDGVVVSDWTAVRSTAAANAEQDLAMPGPLSVWTDALVEAVRRGEVDERAIDRKVERLVTLARRVAGTSALSHPEIDGISLAREIESTAIVLAANDGLLPLTDAPGLTIAVIGQSAVVARIAGGGSATVIPEHISTPLDGIVRAFPLAEVSHHIGALIDHSLQEIPIAQLTNPATGGPGARVTLLDEEGHVIHAEDRLSTRLIWLGSRAPIHRAATAIVEATWTPIVTGRAAFGVASVGQLDVAVGQEQWVVTIAPSSSDIATALFTPTTAERTVTVEAGVPVPVRIVLRRALASDGAESAMSLIFGCMPQTTDEDRLLDDAVAAARAADVVVLVVGTTSEVESEGFDRTSLSLPGRQDELARRVLAVNPRTAVVVNSGAPVVLPWHEGAAAVLLSWYGGQEYGNALADVVRGSREPGGRLSVTWPGDIDDVPVLTTTPEDGRLVYTEGIHVGYRAWSKAGRLPQWAFGHGLGYSRWRLSITAAPLTVQPDAATSVRISVTNSGDRRSRQVVQVYASRPESGVDRPVLWLAGFAVVELDARETGEVAIDIPARTFAHWHEGSWSYEPGGFVLSVGFASDALADSAAVRMSDA